MEQIHKAGRGQRLLMGATIPAALGLISSVSNFLYVQYFDGTLRWDSLVFGLVDFLSRWQKLGGSVFLIIVLVVLLWLLRAAMYFRLYSLAMENMAQVELKKSYVMVGMLCGASTEVLLSLVTFSIMGYESIIWACVTGLVIGFVCSMILYAHHQRYDHGSLTDAETQWLDEG